MPTAHINPEIIKWARKSLGLNHTAVSTSQIRPDQIEAWESGRSLPTYNQAEKLAEKLRIPFLVLFLSKPPASEIGIPDLRTVNAEPLHKASTDLRQVISDTLIRQDWYREYRLEHFGARAVLPFVGSACPTENPNKAAQKICAALSLNDAVRGESQNYEQFLNTLIVRSEEIGILVFRSALVGMSTTRKLRTEEFRGFALSDEVAPVVFINAEDAKAAQIFTLMHELAHVWIGITGVSDPRIKTLTGQLPNAVERFCNQVAAECLAPSQDFRTRWRADLPIARNMRTLSLHYRVSSLVVLIQARDLGLVDISEFSTVFDAEMREFRKKESKDQTEEEKRAKKAGGNFWASFRIRNSKKFVESLIASVREGQTRYTDAASMLSVKAATLERYITKGDQ